MLRLLAASLALCLLAGFLPRNGAAQVLSFNAPVQPEFQSVSVGYFLIDFEHTGDGTPDFLFNFDEPLYGIVITRPSFFISLGFGEQTADVAADTTQDDLRMTDFSIYTWAPLYIAPNHTRNARLFVPITLHTNYRRVAPRSEDTIFNAFNVTMLGLGAGIGANQAAGEWFLLEARVAPAVGVVTSSFGESLGFGSLLDADVQLHIGSIANRFGISLGYSYRRQIWNPNAPDFLPDLSREFFDYRGKQHLFRAGLNF